MATATRDVAHDRGSLSEADSDSDWLEVASNRGTDTDLDGALSESDADPDGTLLSRCSSFDARAVDRWEGFIDSPISRSESPAFVLQRALSPEPAPHAISPLARNVLATEEDLVEDERVRTALDQSMVSTLSGSRSSTAHSRSELRLSFPDPLTSSREDAAHPLRAELSLSSTAFTPTDLEFVAAADDDSDSEMGDEFEGAHAADRDHPPAIEPIRLVIARSSPPSPSPSSSPVLEITRKVHERGGKHLLVLDRLRGYHVSTILAVLSIALGYMISGSFTGQATRALTSSSATTAVMRTISSVSPANQSSSSVLFKSIPSNALMAIPTGQSALAAIPSASSSLTAIPSRGESSLLPVVKARSDLSTLPIPSVPVAGPSSAGSPSQAGTSAITSALSAVKTTTTSALSVIPTTPSSLSILSPPAQRPRDRKGKAKAVPQEAAAAVGAWLGHTLELMLDADAPRALCGWVDASLEPLRERAPATRELRHALDELGGALTAAAHALRTAPGPTLRARHTRARSRARGLRAKGEAWIRNVGAASRVWAGGARERVRQRAETAQDRARTLRADKRAHRAERKAQHAERRAERKAQRAERKTARTR